jgi:hypothetical protein
MYGAMLLVAALPAAATPPPAAFAATAWDGGPSGPAGLAFLADGSLAMVR